MLSYGKIQFDGHKCGTISAYRQVGSERRQIEYVVFDPSSNAVLFRSICEGRTCRQDRYDKGEVAEEVTFSVPHLRDVYLEFRFDLGTNQSPDAEGLLTHSKRIDGKLKLLDFTPTLHESYDPRKRVDEVLEVCESKAKETPKCDFLAKNDVYDGHNSDSVLVQAASSLAQGFRALRDFTNPANVAFCGPAIMHVPTVAEVLWNEVQEGAKTIAAKHHLTDCGKVCLAKCFSSKLIAYDFDDTDGFKLKDPRSLIMLGKGVCRHAAPLAERLLETLGISAREVAGRVPNSSFGHDWVNVKVGTKEYYIESLSDACQFFPTKYTGKPISN